MASTHSRTKECQKRGTATEHAERKALGDRGTRESWGVATEHAEMSANVVFINIDWKSSRLNPNRLGLNMRLLATTIAGVVRQMNPTMICMCEVGETKHPLSEGQMLQVVAQVEWAWTGAATEDIQLRSMFTAGAPYVTIYIDGPIRCSDHQILCKLYHAGGERRTAQTFVCWFPSGESIDVVNVHAPSGYRTLKDPQTQDTTNDSATEQFANKACWQHWKRPLLDWRRHEHNSSPDVSVVADVSRQWFAAHAGANS